MNAIKLKLTLDKVSALAAMLQLYGLREATSYDQIMQRCLEQQLYRTLQRKTLSESIKHPSLKLDAAQAVAFLRFLDRAAAQMRELCMTGTDHHHLALTYFMEIDQQLPPVVGQYAPHGPHRNIK